MITSGNGRRQKRQGQIGVLAEELVAEIRIGGAEADEGGDHRYRHSGDRGYLQSIPDIRVVIDGLVPVQGEVAERNGREAVGIERKDKARNDRREDKAEHHADIDAQEDDDGAVGGHFGFL